MDHEFENMLRRWLWFRVFREVAVTMLTRNLPIWRLYRDWKISFLHASFLWLFLRGLKSLQAVCKGPIFFTTKGCPWGLNILMTWQLAFSRERDPRRARWTLKVFYDQFSEVIFHHSRFTLYGSKLHQTLRTRLLGISEDHLEED